MMIAIIEDELDLLELLEFNIQKEGFEVIGFTNTKIVKKFITEETPDLLIIDRNLKGEDGLDFVKSIYEEGFNIPVIFLTAKTSEKDVLDGFNIGADDYIKKPFNMNELIARIKAILKRNKKIQNQLSYKNMKLNVDEKYIQIDNIKYNLTNSEVKVLSLFFKNPNKIISKQEIINELEFQNEKSANVSINRITHKVGNIFEIIRGVGYKLK